MWAAAGSALRRSARTPSAPLAGRCPRGTPAPIQPISAPALQLEVFPLTGGSASSASSGAWQRESPVLQQLLHPRSVAVRGFFFPRKNWLPWRVRLIDERKKGMLRKRHVLPRRLDPEEAPIFYPKEDGSQIAFRDKDIRLNMKKLLEYCKLIRGRQLQDGIDWVESLARMQSEPILKTMRRALEECRERHKWDIARTFIFDAQPQRGPFVKNLRKGSKASYGLIKRPRNYFMIRVRQMPLEEFFHRVYVFNKVPRSMASDMRLALHENRVGPQTVKEWAPYLSGRSRFWHRKELKWQHSTRQWDYYEARREWIARYKANLLRASTEARAARGLPPLQMLEQ